MKKLLVFAALFSAVFGFAVSVAAEGKGAVKVEFDPNVGWVILNTTASGTLVATAHLDNGRPNEEFTVTLRIRYEDGSVNELVDIAKALHERGRKGQRASPGGHRSTGRLQYDSSHSVPGQETGPPQYTLCRGCLGRTAEMIGFRAPRAL